MDTCEISTENYDDLSIISLLKRADGGDLDAQAIVDRRLGSAEKLLKYRDDQERDERGRWTASVGGAAKIEQGVQRTKEFLLAHANLSADENGFIRIPFQAEKDITNELKAKYVREGLGARNATRAAEAELARFDAYQRNLAAAESRSQWEERMKTDYPEEYAKYQERKEESQAIIQDAYDNGRVTIAIDTDSFIQVLEDGRFKSQFETKTTHGTPDTELRKVWEDVAQGLPVDMKGSDRPIYGFVTTNTDAQIPYQEMLRGGSATNEDYWRQLLSMNSDAVNHYGEARVVLTPEAAERTTVTVDDSLRTNNFALPMGTQLTEQDHIQNGGSKSGYPADVYVPTARYLETQTVGGVTLSDIAEIHVPQELVSEYQVMLERQGLSIPVIARAE